MKVLEYKVLKKMLSYLFLKLIVLMILVRQINDITQLISIVTDWGQEGRVSLLFGSYVMQSIGKQLKPP